MKTKKFLALVLALVMAFSLVVPASASVEGTIPEPDTLKHDDTKIHDTAKMTVYVTKGEETLVAAVGAINSHMDATLELNYGTYPVDGTITAYGQTEEKANMTEFTLNGTSNTGIDFTTNSNGEENYFPGLLDLVANTPYYIHFVDAMDATATPTDIGIYTFKKATDGEGITLTATNDVETEGEVNLVDQRWQALKDKAFKEDSKNDGDSYISLAAGSYIALNTEKLIAAGTLKLDDFRNSGRVQDNIDNAKKQLMLTTGTNLGYQILLKKGTRFKLGNSYADVRTDLLITMTGNEAFNENNNYLRDIYTNLTSNGKVNLAKNMLNLFSYIAGSVRSGSHDEPVVITFGTPTSSSTTVETQVIDNENVAGTKDVITKKTEITTTTSTENNVETRTVTETVTTTSSTVTPIGDDSETSASYSVQFDRQIVTTTTTTVGDNEPVQTVDSGEAETRTNTVTLKADPADDTLNLSTANTSAKIADANLGQLKEDAKATIVTEAVTQAQGSSKDVTVTLAIVATALNADGGTTKRYDVKPVVTTQVGTGDPITAPVSNADLQGSFTIELPVPANIAGNDELVKITHTSEGLDTEEYTETVENGKVSVTITHFSTFELAPVEVSPSISKAKVNLNLTLSDAIRINFIVHSLTEEASNYSVKYWFKDDSEETVTYLSDLVPNNEGKYKIVAASCAAKEMTDTVHFELWCSNEQLCSFDYSIQNYCNTIIGSSSDAELVNLCKAVLDYGSRAQKYFSYKENSLANGGSYYFTPTFADEDNPVITEYNAAGTTVKANLTLESETELNLTLGGTEDTLSITSVKDVNADNYLSKDSLANGTAYYTVDYNSAKATCTVKVKGIPAKYLNHVYEVNFTYNGEPGTIQCSPMNYAYACRTRTDGLGYLCKALYQYWKIANTYFS